MKRRKTESEKIKTESLTGETTNHLQEARPDLLPRSENEKHWKRQTDPDVTQLMSSYFLAIEVF